MAEKSTSKFTSAMLGDPAGEATAPSLLSDFAEQRYLSVAQENPLHFYHQNFELEKTA